MKRNKTDGIVALAMTSLEAVRDLSDVLVFARVMECHDYLPTTSINQLHRCEMEFDAELLPRFGVAEYR